MEEKKTTKKKTLDDAKVKEAKKKINDLLAGTGLEDKAEEVFTPPIQDEYQPPSNANANEWLQEQVTALTQQVEKYEKLITQLRVENQNLMNSLNTSGAVTSDMASASSEAKIVEIYKHFENIYTGRNPMRQSYDTVKFSNPQHGNGVLDVFLHTFVFLNQVKNYRHKG